MSNWNRSKWGWYFAADKGVGSGPPVEPEEEEVEADEPKPEGEEDTDEEEDSSTEDADDEEDKSTPPEPQVRELTDDEIAEKAKALGFVKPEPKEEPKPEAKAAPVIDVPDFRGNAAAAVADHPDAAAKGWVDEDGDLTPLGQSVAENYALKLSSDHSRESAEVERERMEIQANRPQYAEQNVKFLKDKFGFDEDGAQSIGRTMTDILVDSYGAAALKPKTPEEAETAKRLWSTAYYTALGIETHNARTKAAEGGDKGDGPAPEKPKGAGGSDGVLADLSKEDRDWIEKDYIPRLKASKGADYKPTKDDYKRAKELINR